MHQAVGIALNARFKMTRFLLPADDMRSIAGVKEVDGSQLDTAFAVIRVEQGVLAQVTYGEGKPYAALVELAQLAGGSTSTSQLYLRLGDAPLALGAGNVTVELRKASGKGSAVELRISNEAWQYKIMPGSYRTVAGHKNRIDISIKALIDPLKAAVKPHGLIGQGFDGLAIDGATDSYAPNAHGVFTTTAQCEGAIEGTAKDYVVSSPFATDFKYERFGASSAPSRDVSKLSGNWVNSHKPLSSNAGGTGEGDVLEA